MRTRCSVSCLRRYANLLFQVKRKQGKVQGAKGLIPSKAMFLLKNSFLVSLSGPWTVQRRAAEA